MTAIEQFNRIRILCIGDVMLDRFVMGHVKRISPESPVPVLSITERVIFPGGAANVARNIASLGGRCTLVSVVGRDAVGAELRGSLEAADRITSFFIDEVGRPTSEKTRFIAHGQHMLRADSEITIPVADSTACAIIDAVGALVAQHDVVVLSDYAKGVLTDQVVREVINLCRASRRPVVVDPKSVRLDRYAGATVITPNSKEVLDATEIDPTDDDSRAEEAGKTLLDRCAVGAVLMTRAHRGMTLMAPGAPPLHIAASAREVYDVVGAGDTVIATLALALGAGETLADSARLANFAAGIVVAKRGPATVTQTELTDEILRSTCGSLKGLQSKIVDLHEARELADMWRKNGYKVGFTNGCFDLLHVGHLSILAFSKQHSGRLIVAVNSDASVRRLKQAGRPVNSENDRATVLAALSAVDAVVIFDEDTPQGLIEALNPDVLVKGADYTIAEIVGADHVLAHGGQVLRCALVPDRSTTRVVNSLRQRAEST